MQRAKAPKALKAPRQTTLERGFERSVSAGLHGEGPDRVGSSQQHAAAHGHGHNAHGRALPSAGGLGGTKRKGTAGHEGMGSSGGAGAEKRPKVERSKAANPAAPAVGSSTKAPGLSYQCARELLLSVHEDMKKFKKLLSECSDRCQAVRMFLYCHMSQAWYWVWDLAAA